MIYKLENRVPKIGKNVYIAPNATIIGDIELGKNVSVWFGAVLRGDMSKITVGDSTNIQDNCTVHGDTPFPVIIGDRVTIGHNAIIHGCTIGDNSLIGIGAILLNEVQIPANCIVGAGSVISKKLIIKEGSLIIGNPPVVKKLNKTHFDYLKYASAVYKKDIDLYKHGLQKIS